MTVGTSIYSEKLGNKCGFWSCFDYYLRSSRSWAGDDAAPRTPLQKVYRYGTIPGRTTLKGVVLPPIHWKKRVFEPLPSRARKIREEHAYSLDFASTTEDPLLYHYGGPGSGIGYESVINLDAHYSDASSLWTANDDLSLVAKLRSNIGGSGFNAGVFLAEAPQAIRMIGDSAARIAGAYKSLRRGNVFTAWNYLVRGTAQKHLKLPRKTDNANFWLQAQYGWKPLVQDVADGAIFLDQTFGYPRQQVVTATRFAGGQKVHTSNPLLSAFSGGINLYYVKEMTYSKKIRAIIRDVDTIRLAGLTDPASVAWEILPFSFVADWFIPVGRYLDALSLQRAVQATYVTTTKITVKKGHAYPTYQPGYSPGSYTWYSRADSWSAESIHFSRAISSQLNIPLPVFKPMAQSLSLSHAANAIALLVQRHGS